jgi:hypothetical protein
MVVCSIALISCNIKKDLRKQNRCNKKLEKLVERCPNLVQLDTIHDTVTVIVPKIEIKDSLILSVDTVVLDSLLKEYNILLSKKDKINFIETFRNSITIDTLILDSLYKLQITLSNGVLSYNIVIHERIIEKPIETIIQSVKLDKLTWWENIRLYLGKWFKWLIVLAVILGILYLLKKIFNTLK